MGSLAYAGVPVSRGVRCAKMQGQPERVWGADAGQLIKNRDLQSWTRIRAAREAEPEKHERFGEHSWDR